MINTPKRKITDIADDMGTHYMMKKIIDNQCMNKKCTCHTKLYWGEKCCAFCSHYEEIQSQPKVEDRK